METIQRYSECSPPSTAQTKHSTENSPENDDAVDMLEIIDRKVSEQVSKSIKQAMIIVFQKVETLVAIKMQEVSSTFGIE